MLWFVVRKLTLKDARLEINKKLEVNEKWI